MLLIGRFFKGKRLGKLIFSIVLQIIEKERNDILRVELIAKNQSKAIQLYKKLGFIVEGRFEKRISTSTNSFEADISDNSFNQILIIQ